MKTNVQKKKSYKEKGRKYEGKTDPQDAGTINDPLTEDPHLCINYQGEQKRDR